MGYDFNADEIFEIAVNMERNGAEFYRQAAAAASEEADKKKLLDLSQMEVGHEAAFSTLRQDLMGKEKQKNVFDPDDQAVLYLKAMADGYALDHSTPPDELVAGKGIAEILRVAIGLEKDAIIFYLGLRDLVPTSAGRDKVDWIIGQEKGHIVALSAQLRALK